MIRVSVLIPTFRRPDGFVRAARSVFAQRSGEAIDLVAVDNSPEGSALSTFSALAAESPIPFSWTHASKPGVAQARNAALAMAQGETVAWLDDDEEAPAHWLASLLEVQRNTSADCVFGPVRARAQEGVREAGYFEALYSRTGPQQSGATDDTYGIGNSLQTRTFFDSLAPFDTRADQTGGEDDRLFAAAKKRGVRFAWAADAWVTEHIDTERTELVYALKRAFAYGQGPCETAWNERDALALARHMGVGAAQAVLFGAAAAGARVAQHPQALPLLDRAARGAGKVFWFVEQRFYGAALVKAQPA